MEDIMGIAMVGGVMRQGRRSRGHRETGATPPDKGRYIGIFIAVGGTTLFMRK